MPAGNIKKHYATGDRIAWTDVNTGLVDTGQVVRTAVIGGGQDVCVKRDGSLYAMYIPQSRVIPDVSYDQVAL